MMVAEQWGAVHYRGLVLKGTLPGGIMSAVMLAVIGADNCARVGRGVYYIGNPLVVP